MAKKLRNRTLSKVSLRAKRHLRHKNKLQGSAERPRLSVFRSNKNMYAQIIDDSTQTVLCHASTLKDKKGHSIGAAARVGEQLAKRAEAKKIKKVVFDNAGYKFHGRVKSLAEAARKGGLSF